MVEAADPVHGDPTAEFYRHRLAEMEKFFATLDKLVDAVQALSELRLSALAELGRDAKDDERP